MTRVIEVPAHFDDRSFDTFAAGFGEWPPSEKVLVDARGTQWASPYGLIGILTAGQALSEAKCEKPLLTVPTSDEVKRYWARAGFFTQAAELFELHGKVPRAATTGPSDVLLDVTPVRASEDVHGVVHKISDGAALEAALIQNVSRFRDPGRGQGLAFIKRFLDQWEGKISIRSGTARLSIVPPWDEDVPMSDHLPHFPGAQVQIIIPAQEAKSR